MEEVGFLDKTCSSLEFHSPEGLAQLAGLGSSSYHPSSTGQSNLTLDMRPFVSGSTLNPSNASIIREKAGDTKRLRDLAVTRFRVLIQETFYQGMPLNARNEREFRDRLYQNLEACCAAPEHGAKTCDCASIIELLRLPKGYPVCDPRYVGATYQKMFLEGRQTHTGGHSSSVPMPMDNDPPGPCPLRPVHMRLLPSIRRRRETSSRGSGTHKQAGKRNLEGEGEQSGAKRSRGSSLEGDFDGLGQGPPEVSGLASGAAEGTNVGQPSPLEAIVHLRPATETRVRVALHEGDRQALCTITLCFQQRPPTEKDAFLGFLRATSFSPLGGQPDPHPVDHQITCILWDCNMDSVLLEVLAGALGHYSEQFDNTGLAFVALGVLDAFRSSHDKDLGPELGSVDVGSAGGQSLLRLNPDVPKLNNCTEGAATGTISWQGGSSDWSLGSQFTESTCTAVDSSVSSFEEMGDSCESADRSAPTRVSVTKVGGGQEDSGWSQGSSFRKLRLLREALSRKIKRMKLMALRLGIVSLHERDERAAPLIKEQTFLRALDNYLEQTGGKSKELVLQLEEETMAFQRTLALQARLDERGAAVGRKRAALEELLGPSGSLGAWMREERPADAPATGSTTASDASLADSEESTDDATSSVGLSASGSTLTE